MAAMVKSVEFIEVSQTGTISNVNLTKGQDYENCVPFMTLHGCSDYMDSHAQDVWFSGTTASGVINFQRDETRSCTMYIKCFVVEFDPNEVKVQQEQFTSLPAGTTTDYFPSSSFDPDKTAMVHYWWCTSGAQYWAHCAVRGRVSALGDRVDMYRNYNSGTVSGHYFLFEDISGSNDHFSVSHQDKSFTGTASDCEVPEERRDPSRTIVIGSFACNNTAAGDSNTQTVRMFMYFTGLFRADRQTATSTIWYSMQLLTFNDTSRVYVTFQHYTGFNTSQTVITNGWTRPANLEKAAIIPTVPMGIQRGTNTSAAELDSLWCSMKFTGSTGAQFQRNSTGAPSSSYFGYSVVDWGGAPVNVGTNPSPMSPALSPVKSVENFRISIGNYWQYQDLSKGQVVENCALFVTCRNSGGSDEIREAMHDVFIREPGIVIAHSTDSGGTGVVDVSVVEFYPDQVKVQQGKFRLWGNGNPAVTFALDGPIDLSKAFVIAKWETNEATYWSRVNLRIRLLSAGSVEVYRHDVGNTIHGTYFVIEDLGNYFEVTHYTPSSTTANTLGHYATGSSYFPYYSNLPITSFATSQDTDDVDDSTGRVYAVGGGRQTWNCQATGGTRYVAFQWVKFLDERIHTQFRAPSFTTNTVITYTNSSWHDAEKDNLSVINPMLSGLGRGTTTAATGRRQVFHNIRLINNNTEVEISRENGGATMYASYCTLINWIGHTHPDADENHQIEYAYPTTSLVRSVEKLTYTGTSHYPVHFLSKGQRPENCVPFGSRSTAATDGEVCRIIRFTYIDKNSKVMIVADGGTAGGNVSDCTYVVEFDPAQVRVQQLWIPFTGTTRDFTIPIEVDLSKTFLIFGFSADNWGNRFDYNSVTAEFIDSTTLRFSRYASSAGVYVMAYLVECLQDQWFCNRDTDGSTGGTNMQSYVSNNYSHDMRIIQGSNSVTDTSDDVDNNTYRLYPRQDHGFEWNRQASAGSMSRRHIETLEFNPTTGARVGGYWLDLNSASETKSTVNYDPLDLDRSVVFGTITNSFNRGDYTAASYVSHVNVRLELTGPQEVTTSRHSVDGSYTYGWFQWIEWPEYKSHYFEGTVKEKGTPVVRQLACYRADTHELMDSTTSASGTGEYYMETTHSGTHYIICQDDEPGVDYNDLILGKMEPYPLPTYSGGQIIYG